VVWWRCPSCFSVSLRYFLTTHCFSTHRLCRGRQSGPRARMCRPVAQSGPECPHPTAHSVRPRLQATPPPVPQFPLLWRLPVRSCSHVAPPWPAAPANLPVWLSCVPERNTVCSSPPQPGRAKGTHCGRCAEGARMRRPARGRAAPGGYDNVSAGGRGNYGEETTCAAPTRHSHCGSGHRSRAHSRASYGGDGFSLFTIEQALPWVFDD